MLYLEKRDQNTENMKVKESINEISMTYEFFRDSINNIGEITGTIMEIMILNNCMDQQDEKGIYIAFINL